MKSSYNILYHSLNLFKNLYNLVKRLLRSKYSATSFLLLLIIGLVGCKKFVDITAPATSTSADIVFSDDARAASVLTNLYAKISNSNYDNDGGIGSISVVAELSADNLELFGTTYNYYVQHYQNIVSPQYNNVTSGKASFWQQIYPLIYITNAAIEGLTLSTTLTPIIKQRLLGEAYFLRAFYYFYLTNFYGEVPLALTTDYKVNARLTRASPDLVYTQMIDDLNKATTFLTDDYVNGDAFTTTSSTERVRPNRQAAFALLARIQLYAQHYVEAEKAATEVLSHNTLYTVDIPLNTVFLKSSKEIIWSLQPVRPSFNTLEGDLFNLSIGGPDATLHPFYLSNTLMSNENFDSSDLRKATWTKSITVNSVLYPYANKYKASGTTATISEYPVVLRLAEQYLIRAEARAELNNISGAKSDLNVIRNRAALTNTIANTQSDLRTAILKERRVELFTEWGHRWLDLKRTEHIDAVMILSTPLKGGGEWNSTKALWPVPIGDINLNPVLTQNPGYSN